LEEAEVVPAPSTQSPEEVLIKQEQSRELGRLLDSLAPRHKEVITLKYFGELRNQEIATILGLVERTVAAYFHRGLQELQRRYHLEHSSALPSGTLLPGRITPPASFSPILPQGGIMNSKQPQFWLAQPGNLTNLNYTPPRPYPMGQPGWAVGIEVGESLGSEEFSSDWLELLGLISYLKRVVPQADETLRLRLKGYLLAQLQHQPKPVPLNSRC
jgi:DNA-binding CsgD family transcriptional regulator